MDRAKSEKIRLLVAFGDISGFSDFCDGITNDEVEYDPVMDRFDEIVEKAAQRTGYSFDDTGDGFMCTVDLSKGHASGTIIGVLLDLYAVLVEIEAALDHHRQESLCPNGFRIVVTAGYAKRKIKKDGRIILRGKIINQAHNYLDSARGHGLVVHDSARSLIPDDQAEQAGIDFVRLRKFPMLSVVTVRSDRRRSE